MTGRGFANTVREECRCRRVDVTINRNGWLVKRTVQHDGNAMLQLILGSIQMHRQRLKSLDTT